MCTHAMHASKRALPALLLCACASPRPSQAQAPCALFAHSPHSGPPLFALFALFTPAPHFLLYELSPLCPLPTLCTLHSIFLCPLLAIPSLRPGRPQPRASRAMHFPPLECPGAQCLPHQSVLAHSAPMLQCPNAHKAAPQIPLTHAAPLAHAPPHRGWPPGRLGADPLADGTHAAQQPQPDAPPLWPSPNTCLPRTRAAPAAATPVAQAWGGAPKHPLAGSLASSHAALLAWHQPQPSNAGWRTCWAMPVYACLICSFCSGGVSGEG